MKQYPYKLPFGVQVYGKSVPVWVYDSVPEGMKRVTSIAQIRSGQGFLYACGSTPGEYMTGVMRPQIRRTVEEMIAAGIPVFVK